jgi:hypothetical protein
VALEIGFENHIDGVEMEAATSYAGFWKGTGGSEESLKDEEEKERRRIRSLDEREVRLSRSRHGVGSPTTSLQSRGRVYRIRSAGEKSR